MTPTVATTTWEGFALAERRTRAARFMAVRLGCFLTLFGLTYMQRLGYVLSEKSQLSACVPVTAIALAFFYLSGLCWISVRRLALLFVALAAIIVSLYIAMPLEFSTTSLLYLFVLYIPYAFVCPVDEEEYKSILLIYQLLLLPLAVIAIVQFAMTMTGHVWYDFLFLLPEKFVLIGYNTHPPISYESPIIRANAEFFLEPSFVSQFMALAILIEMIFFRVYWRMALYAGGLIASLSGTGFVLLGVVATYVMISRRQWLLIAAGVLALGLVASFQHVPILSEMLGRATEFQSERSSSFIRFVAPFVAIGDALGNDFTLWLGGVGPGQSKELIFDGYQVNPFAVAKLIIENGVIGCIPFMIAITYCFFDRCFDRALAAGLYLMYMLLSGSLQQPHTVYLFLVISILFIPLAKADGAGAEKRRSGTATPAPG